MSNRILWPVKTVMRKKLSKPNGSRNSCYRFRLHIMTGLVWLFRAIKVITVLSVFVYYSRRIKVLASACIEIHTVRENIELSGVSPPPPPMGDYDRIRYFQTALAHRLLHNKVLLLCFSILSILLQKRGW